MGSSRLSNVSRPFKYKIRIEDSDGETNSLGQKSINYGPVPSQPKYTQREGEFSPDDDDSGLDILKNDYIEYVPEEKTLDG